MKRKKGAPIKDVTAPTGRAAPAKLMSESIPEINKIEEPHKQEYFSEIDLGYSAGWYEKTLQAM